MPTLAIVSLVVLSLAIVAVMAKTLLWLGRDARARGFSRPWVLQLVALAQFPWAFLMYYLVCRRIDEQNANG